MFSIYAFSDYDSLHIFFYRSLSFISFSTTFISIFPIPFSNIISNCLPLLFPRNTSLMECRSLVTRTSSIVKCCFLNSLEVGLHSAPRPLLIQSRRGLQFVLTKFRVPTSHFRDVHLRHCVEFWKYMHKQGYFYSLRMFTIFAGFNWADAMADGIFISDDVRRVLKYRCSLIILDGDHRHSAADPLNILGEHCWLVGHLCIYPRVRQDRDSIELAAAMKLSEIFIRRRPPWLHLCCYIESIGQLCRAVPTGVRCEVCGCIYQEYCGWYISFWVSTFTK